MKSSTLRVVATLIFVATAHAILPTPITDPPWPSDYPDSDLLRHNPSYLNSSLSRHFQCVVPRINTTSFNLAKPADCKTQLSQDIYGFGVRVGYYVTWLSSLVANVILEDEILGALAANSIFLFALELSMVKATFIDHNEVYRVDVIILFLIGSGTTVGSLSLWGYRTKLRDREKRKEDFGGVGTFIRIVLCFLFNMYALWFWKQPFKPDTDPKQVFFQTATCDPRCWNTWIFGQDTSGGIKWLLFTFSLLWEFYWGILLVLWPVARVPKLKKFYNDNFAHPDARQGPEIRSKPSKSLTSALQYADSPERPRWTFFILPAVCLVWFIFIIAITEQSLQQNHVGGIAASSPTSGTPAQLIPFLIGAVTFVRLLWMFCVKQYHERKKRRTLKGVTPSSKNIKHEVDSTELENQSLVRPQMSDEQN